MAASGEPCHVQVQARDSDRNSTSLPPIAESRSRQAVSAPGPAVEALQMVKAGDGVDIMWTVALLVSFAEVNK